VLADNRWLGHAASVAGVPQSELTVKAGAIPETTLINVTATAKSATAAERALGTVLADGIGLASTVSGPFRLEVTATPEGTAATNAPKGVQVFTAFGLAGLVVGVGTGLLITRSARKTSGGPPQLSATEPPSRHARREQTASRAPAQHNGAYIRGSGRPPTELSAR